MLVWRGQALEVSPDRGLVVLGEANVWAFHNPAQVSWLDEDTLVFAGSPRKREVNLRPSHVYLWPVGQAPAIYGDDKWSGDDGYVCAQGGEISISPQPASALNHGPLIVFRGTPGHERKQELAPSTKDAQFWRHQQVNYRTLGSGAASGEKCDYPLEPGVGDHAWVAAHDRDTVLDFGPRGGTYLSITMLKRFGPSIRKVATLPMGPAEVAPFCTDTPAWDNSFVVWNCYGGVRPDRPTRIHRIFPDGSRRVLDVAPDPAIQGGMIVPFRDGYVVVVNPEDSPRSGGIFRLENGRALRLLPGAFAPAAVSPSGCRMALFVYEPGPMSPSTLKIIQLCEPKRHA
uniref:Uncharacterized protein n=1 Tax=Caulobacter sp. (strain K31) TaxID=366602 RepID=B0T0R9_CAUSK